MEETGPAERQVSNLHFQQLCRFKIFDGTPDNLTPKERSQHVAVSNKFGYLFVASNKNTIKVIETAILSKITEDEESAGVTINEFPCSELPLQFRPVHLALSTDNLVLSVVMVAETGLKFHLFHVKDVCQKAGQTKPFIMSNLTKDPSVSLIELSWNPTVAGLCAVCLSNGVFIHLIWTKQELTSIGTQPEDVKATTICWSPKGKQIVIGTQTGELRQYTHNMEHKRTVKKPDFTNDPVKAVDILWLSTFVFAVAYIDVEETLQPNLTIVHAPKDQETSYINFEDICYGTGELRKARYYMQHIDKWDFLIISSSNSLEVAVLGKQEEDKSKWEIWTFDDSARLELPLCNNADTYPLGLGIDFTSQLNFKGANKAERSPVPIIILLSTEGILCPYYMVKTDATESIQQEIEPLGIGGRRENRAATLPSFIPRETLGASMSASMSNVATVNPPTGGPLAEVSNKRPQDVISSLPPTVTQSVGEQLPAAPSSHTPSVPTTSAPAPFKTPTTSSFVFKPPAPSATAGVTGNVSGTAVPGNSSAPSKSIFSFGQPSASPSSGFNFESASGEPPSFSFAKTTSTTSSVATKPSFSFASQVATTTTTPSQPNSSPAFSLSQSNNASSSSTFSFGGTTSGFSSVGPSGSDSNLGGKSTSNTGFGFGSSATSSVFGGSTPSQSQPQKTNSFIFKPPAPTTAPSITSPTAAAFSFAGNKSLGAPGSEDSQKNLFGSSQSPSGSLFGTGLGSASPASSFSFKPTTSGAADGSVSSTTPSGQTPAFPFKFKTTSPDDSQGLASSVTPWALSFGGPSSKPTTNLFGGSSSVTPASVPAPASSQPSAFSFGAQFKPSAFDTTGSKSPSFSFAGSSTVAPTTTTFTPSTQPSKPFSFGISQGNAAAPAPSATSSQVSAFSSGGPAKVTPPSGTPSTQAPFKPPVVPLGTSVPAFPTASGILSHGQTVPQQSLPVMPVQQPSASPTVPVAPATSPAPASVPKPFQPPSLPTMTSVPPSALSPSVVTTPSNSSMPPNQVAPRSAPPPAYADHVQSPAGQVQPPAGQVQPLAGQVGPPTAQSKLLVEPVSPVSSATASVIDETLESALQTNIQDEINHFDKELADLKRRTRNGKYSVGRRDELMEIKKGTDDLVVFQEESLECVKSLNEDVHNLKDKYLKTFTLLEESRIRKQHQSDPRYRRLLESKGLDPQMAEKMQQIHEMQHYLGVGHRDVNRLLDMEWEEHLRRTDLNGSKKLMTPTMDAVYNTIRCNYSAITNKIVMLEDIRSKLQRAQKHDTTGTLYPVPSPKLKLRDVGSLASRLSQTKLHAPPPGRKSTPGTLRRQAHLRDLLSRRTGTPLRSSPKVPINRVGSPTSSYSSQDSFTRGSLQNRLLTFSDDHSPDIPDGPNESTPFRFGGTISPDPLRCVGSPPPLRTVAAPDVKVPAPAVSRQQFVIVKPPQVPVPATTTPSSFAHTGTGTVVWGANEPPKPSPAQAAAAAALSRAATMKQSAAGGDLKLSNLPPNVNIKNLDSMKSSMPPPVTFAEVGSSVDHGTAQVVNQVLAEMVAASGKSVPPPGTPAMGASLADIKGGPPSLSSGLAAVKPSSHVVTASTHAPITASVADAPKSGSDLKTPVATSTPVKPINLSGPESAKPSKFDFSVQNNSASANEPGGYSFAKPNGQTVGIKPAVLDRASKPAAEPQISFGGRVLSGTSDESNLHTHFTTPGGELVMSPDPLASESLSLPRTTKAQQATESLSLRGLLQDSPEDKPPATLASSLAASSAKVPTFAAQSSSITAQPSSSPFTSGFAFGSPSVMPVLGTSTGSSTPAFSFGLASKSQGVDEAGTKSITSVPPTTSIFAPSSVTKPVSFVPASDAKTTTSSAVTTSSSSETTAGSSSVFSKPGQFVFKPATGTSLAATPAAGTAATTSSAFSFGSLTSPSSLGFSFEPPKTCTSSAAAPSLFGSSPATTSTTSSLFGQPISSPSTSTTSASATLFGQTSSSSVPTLFGTPSTSMFAQKTAFGSGGFSSAQPATTASSVFGQPSGFGSSGSAFGQSSSGFGTSTTSSATPSFGQPSGGLFGQSAQPASTSAGDGGMFEGGDVFGLGGKPKPDAANVNPFGLPSNAGSSFTSSSTLFGDETSKTFSTFGSSAQTQSGGFGTGGTFSSGAGGVGQSGFGGFAQQPTGSTPAPSFGGSATFGGTSTFGSSGFGTGASFSNPLGQTSPFGSQTSNTPVFGSSEGAVNQSGGGFESFASQSAPSFGGLASSPPGFGGSGGFGGGGGFGAAGSSGGGFGGAANTGGGFGGAANTGGGFGGAANTGGGFGGAANTGGGFGGAANTGGGFGGAANTGGGFGGAANTGGGFGGAANTGGGFGGAANTGGGFGGAANTGGGFGGFSGSEFGSNNNSSGFGSSSFSQYRK